MLLNIRIFLAGSHGIEHTANEETILVHSIANFSGASPSFIRS